MAEGQALLPLRFSSLIYTHSVTKQEGCQEGLTWEKGSTSQAARPLLGSSPALPHPRKQLQAPPLASVSPVDCSALHQPALQGKSPRLTHSWAAVQWAVPVLCISLAVCPLGRHGQTGSSAPPALDAFPLQPSQNPHTLSRIAYVMSQLKTRI